MDDRAYMVTAFDEFGDIHLFATNNRERAECTLKQFQEDLTGASANWIDFKDNGPSGAGSSEAEYPAEFAPEQ